MRKCSLLLLLLLLLIFSKTSSLKAEFLKIELSKSKEWVERGEGFQIYLKMWLDERVRNGIKNIIVTAYPPFSKNGGFEIIPLSLPSFKNDKKIIQNIQTNKISIVKIPFLNPGSSITIVYNVKAPPRIKFFTGVSTREPKVFTFNILYNQNNKIYSLTKNTKIKYTTWIGTYLICGMLGVFIGYFIKISATYLGKKKEDEKKSGFKSFVFFIFKEHLISLGTILAMGFAGLLILAKESLPARGWYDSIIIGLTIALVGDDQLFKRFIKP